MSVRLYSVGQTNNWIVLICILHDGAKGLNGEVMSFPLVSS